MSHTGQSREFSRVHEAELRARPPKTPIRLANDDDELGVLELCKMLHAEIAYHPLNISKVAALVRLATHQGPERRGILGVIGERHALKGAIFLLIEPVWYSDDWVLQEFFNYVRPECRRDGYAQDLVAYAKSCADQINIDLMIGVFNNVRTEAKCRLYRRWLPKVGEFYYHIPPNRPSLMERLRPMAPANKVAAE